MSWLDAQGQPVSQAQVIAKAAAGRIVLLGEQHDKADIHRWQLYCAAALSAHRPIVMGFEMFPARLDPVLAEWVAGDLSEEALLARAEWAQVWGFAPELYMPLFRACREMGWQMRGLNVARSLVRAVGAEGWEGVPPEAREGLTPATPSPLAYRRFIFDLTGGGSPKRKAQDAADPAFDGFVRAQEVWDRAFATHLARAAAEAPDSLVLGIIGMGHMQYGGGVQWQLKDFGIEDVTVLLPRRAGGPPIEPAMADAHFLLPPLL